MDKRESREKLLNIAALVTGVALVLCLIIYTRDISWFTSSVWSQVSIIKCIIIAVVLGFFLVVQYYFLMLFRYSIARILVFWLLPIIWLFNNGLVAIHRLFESAAEETSLTGWIPVTDLAGWLTGAVFFPLFTGGGIAVGIIDSVSQLLSQACNVAGMSPDSGGIISFITTYLELLGSSFLQVVLSVNSGGRSFFDLGLSGIFNLPNWFFSAGYSFTCIIT